MRARGLGPCEEVSFRTSMLFRYRFQMQENPTISKIGARYNVLNSIENKNRSSGVEKHLILVGVQLTSGEAAAGCDSTKGIGNPW